MPAARFKVGDYVAPIDMKVYWPERVRRVVSARVTRNQSWMYKVVPWNESDDHAGFIAFDHEIRTTLKPEVPSPEVPLEDVERAAPHAGINSRTWLTGALKTVMDENETLRGLLEDCLFSLGEGEADLRDRIRDILKEDDDA